jgi:hypothetical protein
VVLEKKIARMSRDGQNRPYDPVKIRHIDIVNSTSAKPSARKTSGNKPAAPGKTAPKQ